MKNPATRQIAFLVSFVASVIPGILLVLFKYLFPPVSWYIMLASLVLVFGCAYWIVFRLLNHFIIKKINPINKPGRNVNIPVEILDGDSTGREIISEVTDEGSDWDREKTRQIDQMKQTERYRKEFLGNVSHELKTPIFNIQGYILTLLDGGLEDPSINRLYLERTEKSINRMISIVEDLETISRLESADLKLQVERFDIVQLAEEVIEQQEVRAANNKIRLKIKESPEKAVWVSADKKRIFELLSNLVINSIIYGKKNGETVISFLETGENIYIDISDDGIGIPEKDLGRIFERFYRVDHSRSRRIGGTGLGLAIVKHIIEAHNQTLNVRSSLKKGSSFAFTLKKA